MDQAAGLRALVRRQQQESFNDLRHKLSPRTRIIAVTSGKGGVGKSNVVANAAIAIAQRGERVAILDADYGLANIDVLYGVSPRYNLSHVLSGERRLKEIVMRGPHGILLIPASSGIQELADLTYQQREDILTALAGLGLDIDYLLIDTASGIAQNVTHLLGWADDVVIVTTPEPTALVDAYAIIKLVYNEYPTKSISVVVNQVEHDCDADFVIGELNRITEQFLRRRVDSLGAIRKDEKLVQAVQAQKPLLDFVSDSPAIRDLRSVADKFRLARKLTNQTRRVITLPRPMLLN